MALYNGNPALARVQKMNDGSDAVRQASYGGIAWKSIYFVLLTILSALASFIFSVFLIDEGNTGLMIGLIIGSSILALITSFIAIFNPRATKIAGSIYAVAQGFTIGFIALIFTSMGFGGEVFAALFAILKTYAAYAPEYVFYGYIIYRPAADTAAAAA